MHVVKIACERPDDVGRSLSQWDCREIARQLVRDGVVSFEWPMALPPDGVYEVRVYGRTGRLTCDGPVTRLAGEGLTDGPVELTL